MVAGEPGFQSAHVVERLCVPGTKGPKRSLALKCSNLARGESMKDPVSVLGCWQGFHLPRRLHSRRLNLRTAQTDYFTFFSRSSRPIFQSTCQTSTSQPSTNCRPAF